MMISPESYFEMNLKGKAEKEIRSVIRGLKKSTKKSTKNKETHYGAKGTI